MHRLAVLPILTLVFAVACDGSRSTEPTSLQQEVRASDFQSVTVPAHDVWIAERAMLRARQFAQAGTINNTIYVVGGANASNAPTATVQAYNAITDSWSYRKSLPLARAWTNGATPIAGRLYVSGGYNKNTLFVYDPGANSWTRRANMPTVAFYGAQGVINGLLYVYAGGTLGTTPGGHGFWRYNPATNRWVTLKSPRFGHAFPGSGVIGGKFYLAGGESDGARTANVEVYNPATNTWTTKSPMPEPAQGMASAVIGGKLYLAGGYAETGATIATVRKYDPTTNTWTSKASMPTRRRYTASAVAGGRFFVIGGSTAPAGPPVVKVEAYTP